MAITKQKGDIAEAFVTYILKKNGFNVMASKYESRFDLLEK